MKDHPTSTAVLSLPRRVFLKTSASLAVGAALASAGTLTAATAFETGRKVVFDLQRRTLQTL